MPLILRFYLNTALASVALFVLLALWGCYTAIRNGAITPNYSGALLLSQVALLGLCMLHIVLRVRGLLANYALLPLIYHLVALAVLPCARPYLNDQSPRRQALGLALSCVFTSGMVIRALHSGAAPQ